MSTRGVLKIGNIKYGIWHDAYPNNFGMDLEKYKKGIIKWETLKSKYNLTKNKYPTGVFNEWTYTFSKNKNIKTKVKELIIPKKQTFGSKRYQKEKKQSNWMMGNLRW